jgi:uncharacterized OB-fold protein
MSASAPAPVVDADSAPFWTALGEHQILVQTCRVCGERRCPPLPACMNCGSPSSDVGYASGRGQVYSWIVVHRPLGTITDDEVPCTIATVQLDEGFRLVARIDDASGTTADQPVRAVYVDHDGWTELRFTPERAGQ